MELLEGEHFVGVLDLLLVHALVVLCQLEFQKLEVVLVSDEGVGSERHV